MNVSVNTKPIILRNEDELIICVSGKKLVLNYSKYKHMTDDEIILLYITERSLTNGKIQ